MKYTCFDNMVVDLADSAIYAPELLNMNVNDLFSKCMAEAGQSLFYMDFLHVFHDMWDTQRVRVAELCEELSDIWNNRREFDSEAKKCTMTNEDEYRKLLLSWLFRFQDETENQC